MKELEQKLRTTLKFYLDKLPDEQSKDFMINLIMRDIKAEMKDILLSLYYGEDLKNKDVMEFYKNIYYSLLQQVK